MANAGFEYSAIVALALGNCPLRSGNAGLPDQVYSANGQTH